MAAERTEGYDRIPGTLRSACNERKPGRNPGGSEDTEVIIAGFRQVLLRRKVLLVPKGSGWDDLSGCPYGELDSATDAFGSFAGICTLGVFQPRFCG